MEPSADKLSIDPTINSVSHFREARSLDELTIASGCVYLFDFDGVVASRFDDDIYRLEPSQDEAVLLAEAAQAFGIQCLGMEQRYQRHLLYQAAACKLQCEIERGPAFSKAKEAGDCAQLFILTARSGWHAVERMRRFIATSKLRPVEIFNVGRVKKDRQVELVCREFAHTKVFYVEDSMAHLAVAASVAASNLHLTYVEPALQPTRAETYLRAYATKVLASAITSVRRGGALDERRIK